MTVRQLQAEPHNRLSKSFKGASFRDRPADTGRSAAANFRAASAREGTLLGGIGLAPTAAQGVARWEAVDYKSDLQPPACKKGNYCDESPVKDRQRFARLRRGDVGCRRLAGQCNRI